VWLVIGLVIYGLYSYRHSHLSTAASGKPKA
jgi:APA family basic amino acid/polyamine antiporter